MSYENSKFIHDLSKPASRIILCNILVCKDNSFYIGLTNDLIKRFEEHCEGIYETCYTFKRRPLVLVYYETIPFLQDAFKREKQLKGWTRAKKITLKKQDYHNLQLLAQCKNFLIINIKTCNYSISTSTSLSAG